MERLRILFPRRDECSQRIDDPVRLVAGPGWCLREWPALAKCSCDCGQETGRSPDADSGVLA
jgi:hypothetical protein